ncbi:E3 ubiquitin ligase family protein [Pseudonocardia xinjiangensis]|uniref:E3 ubiquitin ligase family protein n=1 Tax=Pseudonocardia xinjiangensis TaxID=75289 RepID=UPI003D8C4824
MALAIIGVVLLVGAAVAVGFALRGRRRWQAMLGTETSTVAELAGERATVHQLGGGGFRRIAEVTGAAAIGPVGELTSELAGLSCVWFRYEVRRRYWYTTTDSEGRTSRSERKESVAKLSSSQPFRLTDETGSVLIEPGTLAIDHAERVVERFEPAAQAASTFSLSIGGLTFGNRGNDTIGYEYEEWVVRPGTRLYVLGEANDRNGELTVGKPVDGGMFVISTRSEAELRSSAQRTQRILMWVGLAAAVVGIALLVVAAVR